MIQFGNTEFLEFGNLGIFTIRTDQWNASMNGMYFSHIQKSRTVKTIIFPLTYFR